jgi:hypothetical protein
MTRKTLLVFGILSSVLYVAMNVFIPMQWDGMMLAIGFGAVALRKHFRRFSIVTLAIILVFGALTVPYAPRLEANLPTPWLGVWERISIGAFLLWVVVLAITLLTVHDAAATRTSARRAA